MLNNRQSIWDAAFPQAGEQVEFREPDFSRHPQFQPMQQNVPQQQDYYPQPAPPVSREPLPGKKLLIGSLMAIVAGGATAFGYDIGLPITPGEGFQMAWGGVMGVFAHLRFKKMQ